MEQSDREIPKPKPAMSGGIRYEVVRNARMRGFDQAGGVIAAFDVKSKAELWILKVYDVNYEEGEEDDVQDVFITDLQIDTSGKHLLVINERGQIFQVDPASRAVSVVGQK